MSENTNIVTTEQPPLRTVNPKAVIELPHLFTDELGGLMIALINGLQCVRCFDGLPRPVALDLMSRMSGAQTILRVLLEAEGKAN